MKSEMQAVVNDLNEVINSFSGKLKSISDLSFAAKPFPNKWSRKEVLGHLIDSAHTNLRRFVVGQHEITPPHLIYEQEFWVTANDYQQASPTSIIDLWTLMNKQIAAVLSKMPESAYGNSVNTGRGEVSLHTLQWLAADYLKHLKHHLNQIIPNSYPVTYP
jgi:hypothetical protein